MKTVLHLGAGLLRALFAMAVGLLALLALFLEVFARGDKGPGERAIDREEDRDFRDTCGMLRPDELGRYSQSGDPDF